MREICHSLLEVYLQMVSEFIHLPLYRFYTQTFRTRLFVLRISDKPFFKGILEYGVLLLVCFFLLRIQEIQMSGMAEMITKYQGDA